jgi:vacuolar-type H+-ATPase subunit E/Vma4
LSRTVLQPGAAPARPEGGDVRDFIRKIDGDRDRELAAIDAELARELRRIATAAYRASRRFHSEHVARTRQSLSQEHDQRISRARAQRRRQRWRLLQEILEQAVWTARERLRQLWHEPGRQLAWCRHWVTRAVEHAGGAPLVVRIGAGGLPATATALRTMLAAYEGGWQLEMDDSVAAGLIIEWEDTMLDGQLKAQRERLVQAIFAELTVWLHQEAGTADEQG